ncbi:hypothetical protein [Streptomyces sp. NPDC091219]|uniref:hypothetical protein n=1 Tax=Streptomyces sp. NPDC091219 TaxID=3155193 RepID=UPI00344E3B3F
MDLMSVVTPGAQSLVTTILVDGWAHVRTALAARWSHRTGEAQTEVERRLDESHQQSITPASGTEAQRTAMEAHWTAFLMTAIAQQPTLLDLVRELGDTSSGSVHNTNSATVTTLVQARDIHGGITFGTDR